MAKYNFFLKNEALNKNLSFSRSKQSKHFASNNVNRVINLNFSNMKKLIYTLTAAVMLSLSVNISTAAAKEPAKQLTEQQQAQVQEIQRRVEEIRSMDKSDLTRQERKELRTELREMKQQANAISGGGVYLSVGAIIIIILLLILIL
jgi:TolA-binding protein